MILIIGGAGQGKLDYVLQKTGYGPAQYRNWHILQILHLTHILPHPFISYNFFKMASLFCCKFNNIVLILICKTNSLDEVHSIFRLNRG